MTTKHIIAGLKGTFCLEGNMRSTVAPLIGNITIWMNGCSFNEKDGYNYCYPTLNGLNAIVKAMQEDYEELDFKTLSNQGIFDLLTDYDKFHAFILKHEPELGSEDTHLFDSYKVQFDSDFDNYIIRCYCTVDSIVFLWKEVGKEGLNNILVNKKLFEQVLAEFEAALQY